MSMSNEPQAECEDIAIVGMSCRFPDANDPETFWINLKNGLESIKAFSDDELLAAGVPQATLDDPHYVKYGTTLDGFDRFDAAFFGFTPREAEITDPQHRMFLELSWHALEHAGHDPEAFQGLIGVFAGMSTTQYLFYLARMPSLVEDIGYARISLGNSKDFLANWVSYKLNLKGPSINVQTACSTSLVATQMACQSLLNSECDMALAGGVTLSSVSKSGYFYQEGGINSPDGHCRAFDARAAGTVGGSGAGIVVLKRLEDAIASGNIIYAVIKGAAINNDGSAKVGFTAPGIKGQQAVIKSALDLADVSAESISYVETHGTGTHLGDPVEIGALIGAFDTDARNFCGIGSLKSNIGHLDVSAGVAGLIKTALALHHKELPASLHFQTPNPQIDFENSPFYVVDKHKPWTCDGVRRAGVSSFGIGGTNAHLILEEAPEANPSEPARPRELIVLSARTETALRAHTHHLSEHLRAFSDLSLSDVAATLRMGRQPMPYRSFWVCESTAGAALTLAEELSSRKALETTPPLVFMFPGQGSTLIGHTVEFYNSEPLFRKTIDHCSALLASDLGLNLTDLLYPDEDQAEEATQRLAQTDLAQPALFVIQYALAKMWFQWGIRPESMIGHSLGEYTVACLAGVFSLEDALALVVTRGRLMQQCQPGLMLSVHLPLAEVEPFIQAPLDLAVVNGPDRCVVSGPTQAIERLRETLEARHVKSRLLESTRAFHSAMMDPILLDFENALRGIQLKPNKIKFISSLTGTWITHEQATDINYWSTQLRDTVRFDLGLAELAKDDQRVFLEVGLGQVLTVLARTQSNNTAIPTMCRQGEPDQETLYRAVGRLWQYGFTFDWPRFEHGRKFQRLPLPLYPFEKKRHWVDIPTEMPTPGVEKKSITVAASGSGFLLRKEQISAELVDLVQRLFGFDQETMATSASFFEMGVDSLLLMQAHQAVQEHFNIEFPYRILFDDYYTVDSLVDFLDEQLPAESFVDRSQLLAIPTTPASGDLAAMQVQMAQLLTLSSKNPVPTDLQSLFRMQLEIITGQINVLKSQTSKTKPIASSTKVTKSGEKGNGVLPFKPVQVGATTLLSVDQEDYLSSFIRRYNEKTKASKQQSIDERRAHADPRSTAGFQSYFKELVYPIIGARSSGSRLWDVDGNEYVDLVNGFGSCLFGHDADFITQSIKEQLKFGLGVGAQSNLAGSVANLIVELTGVERVAFSNTGSEAVMNALRIARTVTGRKKVVTFIGSYHGIFDGVCVRPHPSDDVYDAMPVALGIMPGMVEDSVVLPYGLEETLDIIEHMDEVPAAILVEPVQSRRPDFFPISFLIRLRELTEKKEICLIFDEVITGFRSHPGGAQALANVRADMVIYGKVIGGGMPLGVVAGKARFMDAIDGGSWSYGDQTAPRTPQTMFAGTFCKHPLTMAASLAVLQRLKDEGPTLQENLNQKTQNLLERLQALFDVLGVPVLVCRFSSLLSFRFLENTPFIELFGYFLRFNGLHVWGGGTYFITTAHTDRDFDLVVEGFRKTIEDMREGKLLLPEQEQKTQNDPEIIPLTLGQRQIWAASHLGDDASRAFNESITMRLTGKLDVPALERALRGVMARHQALRLTINQDGKFQSVHPTMSLLVKHFDLSDSDSPELQINSIIAAQVHELFDLENGPLLRSGIIKLGEESHVLVMTFHHIVMDGGSSGVIFRDLKDIYLAECAGTQAHLPKPGRYSDYVAWLEKEMAGPKAEPARSFWLNLFEGEILPLNLPCDRPRQNLQTFTGKKVHLELDAELVKAIYRLSAAHNSSIFGTMLTTFFLLLYRLGGQNDVVVGIGVAGQVYSGIKHLVGYCLGQLPLRNKTPDDPSFLQFLSRTRTLILDAVDNQIYPVEKLMEDLSKKWESSRSQLISVNFNYEQSDTVGSFGNLKSELVINPNNSAKTDAFLNVIEQKGTLTLDFEYNTSLFDFESVTRWLGLYQTLLKDLVAHPEKRLSELLLLREEQRDEILLTWNQTTAPFPSTRCVQELFEEQATNHSNGVALIYQRKGETHVMTYDQLNRHANILARQLRGMAVAPQVPVGLCMARSPEMVVALLAILKAGGAYLPLDPSYPKERLSFMLSDAQVPVILTAEGPDRSLPTDYLGKVVYSQQINSSMVLPDDDTEKNLSLKSVSEQVAYIMYTSGSTGQPKGVQVPHRAIIRLLFGINYVDLNRNRTLLHMAPISFDAATFELWGALLHGARCVLHPEQVPSVQGLGNSLVDHKVDTLFLTTALFNVLVDEATEVLAGVRQLLMGGEKVSVSHVQRARKRLPGTNITHVYGPTESTTFTSFHPIVEETYGATIPIGRPISNTRIYILNHNLEPMPPGIPGELYIGGEGLAHGYLKRPALTAKHWIPSPFNNGQRLYRSGDLARFDGNGSVEFIGRDDAQIKIHGYRIELGEITAMLNEHEEVRESAVVIATDRLGEKRIAAFCVPAGYSDLSELKSYLGQRLPPYMVPSIIEVIDALPLTPNGKVAKDVLEHRALIAPTMSDDSSGLEYQPARNAEEEILVEIWKNLLKLEEVGIHDNFFNLSGDSILAIQVSNRARQAGMMLSPRLLFEHQTIAELSDEGLLTIEEVTAQPAGKPAIEPDSDDIFQLSRFSPFGWNQETLETNIAALESGDDRGLGLSTIADFYPLSSMQEGMLFHTLSEPDTSVYVTQMVLELKGPIDTPTFERSWQKVMDRHPVMRTHFMWKNFEKPVQVVNRQVDILVHHLDWTDVASDQVDEKVQVFLQEDQARGFDLSTAPLQRMSLIKLTETLHIVAWSCHHILLDGWSMPFLFQEMSHYYRGDETELPPPPPFRNYIEWLSGQDMSVAETFWQRYLLGFNSPTPLGMADPLTRTTPKTKHGMLKRILSKESTALLATFAKEQKLTLNTLFQAAWALLLSRYSGERDVLFGSVTSGRPANLPNVETMVGLFINTLPCRVRINGNSHLVQWLHDLQRDQQEVRDYGYSPLVKIHSWSEVPGEAALFDSIMAFESMPLVEEEANAAEETLTLGTRYFIDRPHNPLSFKIFPGDEALIEVYYDGTNVNEQGAMRFLGHLQLILEQLPTMGDLPLSQLSYLNEDERRQILHDFNQTETDYPKLCCHQIFENHAARDPHKLAVVSEEVRTKIFGMQTTQNPGEVEVIDEDVRITYGELNASANRMARFLREKGVGPDEPVGILMDRTVSMIMIMLAIQKAGGAYLPLDVTYPVDRITFMMIDTAASVVLSESAYLTKLHSFVPQTICLDMVTEEVQGMSSENLSLVNHCDNVANVIYTSGSTGKPKGVLITHRGVVSMFCNTNYLNLTPDDCWAQTSNTGFDVATFEIWGALLHGTRLVIVPRKTLLSPAAFKKMLQEKEITCLMLATAVFNRLALEDPTLFNCVKNMHFGGEAVDPFSVRAVLKAVGPERLLNLYGPTETTCMVTWEQIESAADDWLTIPIGIPAANTSLYVMDHHLTPVPVGAPGELLIGGSGLARGYLNRPALTAQVFVPDPIGTTAGARLYRSGDLVQFSNQGRLVYSGRVDSQVKIRGYRIELGEIQNTLKKCDMVRDAVVLAKGTDGGSKQIVAYVVAAGETDLRPTDLSGFLKLTLPEYMIPSVFIPLDSLPINANGKLDMAALPDPDQVRPEYVAPRTEVERTLARIWAEVLQVNKVGINDNYFMLGGDSINAIQITTQAEKADLDFSPKNLFLQPTIAELAAHLEAQQAQEATESELSPALEVLAQSWEMSAEQVAPAQLKATSVVSGSESANTLFPLERFEVFGWDQETLNRIVESLATRSPWPLDKVEDFFPLSPSQQGMFFDSLYDMDPDTFKTWIAYEIEEDFFDVDAFKKSCLQLMNLHPVLRSGLHWQGVDQPLMVIVKDVPVPFELLDWREATAVPYELRWLEMIGKDPGFDFKVAPLLRITLVQFADLRYRLVFRFHHILMDGWCLPIILKQLFEFYAAFSKGLELVVKPFRPYRDYIAWLYTRDANAAENYWKRVMKGFAVTTPVGFDRGANEKRTYGRLHSEVSEKHTNRLEVFAKKNQLTVNTLVQGAWALLLSYYSGQRDIVYGITTSGRPAELAGVDSIIGLFSGAQPARFEIADQNLLQWLQAIQVRQQEDRQYQYNSLSSIKAWSDLAPESPLYESLLSFQNFPLPSTGRGGSTEKTDKLRFSVQHMPARMNTPFTLMVFPAWELSFNMYYDELRFQSKDVTRIWRHFNTLLLSFIDQPDAKLLNISLLDESEHRKLLASFNGPRMKESRQATIDALFEEQVARNPDQLAVYYEGDSLTFETLNRRANQLARYLTEAGVGPESRVAISMGRSLEMIISIIAILKAGGAYVPMEPDYPLERSAFILQDSEASILLTRKPEALGLPPISQMAKLLEEVSPKAAATLIDLEQCDLTSYDDSNLDRGGLPANLAYVIYTSGSTGKPKGVLMDHRGPIDLFMNQRRLFADRGEVPLKMSMNAPISFDVSVGQIIMLLGGNSLFIIPDETRMDSQNFIAYLKRHQLDVLDCTPPHLAVLLDAGLLNHEEDLPGKILVAGSAINQNMWDKLASTKQPRFHNLYGPTEDSVYAIGCAITRGSAKANIGGPLLNTQSALLNHFLRPLPIGVSGEIYLGGPGLARGYLGQPGLTAERFIPDPFSNEPGQRLYKTGDQARALNENSLEYIGRFDDQVKIRGFRIELGEIEACLLKHTGIAAAVVLTETIDDGEKRMKAFVVPHNEGEPSVPDLRQYLNDRMPKYMEPDLFVMLKALPRNSAGKVDRRALLESAEALPMVTAEFVEPQTETEEKVAKIWRDVLRLEKVGIYDRFLDLGGHSLLMVRIHDQIKQTFDTDIHLAMLFEAQNIHGIAAMLTGEEAAEISLSMDKIEDRISKQKAARDRLKRSKKGKGE